MKTITEYCDSSRVSYRQRFLKLSDLEKFLYGFFTAIALTFILNSAHAQAPTITYATPQIYTVGTTITALTPTTGGGAVPATIYGTVTTFAGNTAGTSGRANATGTAASFFSPNRLTIDASGTLYVTDGGNNEIRQVTSAAVVTLLAGSTTGLTGTANGTGTAALFNNPYGITNDAAGNLFVVDNINSEIRKVVVATGVVTLIAGSTTGLTGTTNNTGTLARFNLPRSIVYSSFSNVFYIADFGNNQVRKMTAAGVVTLFAGNAAGTAGSANGTGAAAFFSGPAGLTVDGSGNVYVTDQVNNEIRKITPGGVVTTFAGSTTAGSADGTGAAAQFNTPRGLCTGPSGNIYVADSGNDLIRMITPGGVVTTIAGTAGTASFLNGLGTAATFNNPSGIAFDPTSGNLFVADLGNNAIREVIKTGYTISPALPAGLIFNSATGTITGTPAAASGATNYTIIAYNVSGSGTFTVTLTVNPTVPAGTGGSVCGSGTVTLTASGGTPAGGVYNWYAAVTGGASLGTGTTFITPNLTATTTYYVDYTLNGATSTPRTAVVATVNANPIIATAPTSGAYFSYPFTAGSTTDATGGGNNGTLQFAPSPTFDRFGAANNAYSFNGSSQYISTTTQYSPGPQTFSISVWFKTSTAGGKLVGFGGNQTGSNATFDRHIYIGSDGKVYFGVYNGATKTINSTTTYTDGNWHHAVATFSAANGARLYIDGALQASDATMNTAQVSNGYWRVGWDNLNGWPSRPADDYFTGSLDDIAVTTTELTQAQVNVLYGAGISSGLFCGGNSLSLSVNTVAGATYAWSGPGGFSSTLQNPAVANAAIGTYTCTVTAGVTGCASSISVIAASGIIPDVYTWTGATNTTFTTAGNWDKVPLFDGTDNLVIPTGLANYPVLNANKSIYSLTIASGASLALGGFTLSVGCNIVNSSGGKILYSNNITSQITWNGSVASQSYTGTNTVNTAHVGAMTVNNSANGTVTINSGPVDIYNLLTITQGNLAVAASPAVLTLKSTALLSASVAAIPAASTITGSVNVERYITGGAGYRSYRLVSSPVYAAAVAPNNVYSINYLQNSVYLTGSAGGGFDKTGNPTLYLYREDITPSNATFISGNFWGISKINNAAAYNYYMNGGAITYNIPVGDGFMLFFRGDRSTVNPYVTTTIPVATTLTATGTLNTGQVIVHDWYTPASANLGWTNVTANTAVRGFNLVGNPYASSIDWEQYNTTTSTNGIYTNIVGGMPGVGITIYEFNPATNNYNTYQKGGAFTNHGTRIIASGQGFFVLATSIANPQLIFNESAKTAAQNTGLNLFMATAADVTSLNNANVNQHLRLQLAKDSINTDDIYIGFDAAASSKYVFNEDAPNKSGNGGVHLSSISSDNVDLAINKLPLPKLIQTTIGLKVNATADGVYKLNMTEMVAIPPSFEIWLMDAYKHDSLDMRQNKTYAFNIALADTNSFGSNRFSLVIRQNPALGIHLLSFTAAKASDGAQVEWTTENEQNYTSFTVERSTDNGATFDVLGGFASSASGTYSFLDKKPSVTADQYRLKLEDLNGKITYSAIVTLIYGNGNTTIANNISVYPNPASGVINLTINQNGIAPSANLSALQTRSITPSLAAIPASSSPSYSIKIISITGSVMISATSSSPTWQNSIGNLAPGTYIIQVINNSNNTVVGKSTFVKM